MSKAPSEWKVLAHRLLWLVLAVGFYMLIDQSLPEECRLRVLRALLDLALEAPSDPRTRHRRSRHGASHARRAKPLRGEVAEDARGSEPSVTPTAGLARPRELLSDNYRK